MGTYSQPGTIGGKPIIDIRHSIINDHITAFNGMIKEFYDKQAAQGEQRRARLKAARTKSLTEGVAIDSNIDRLIQKGVLNENTGVALKDEVDEIHRLQMEYEANPNKSGITEEYLITRRQDLKNSVLAVGEANLIIAKEIDPAKNDIAAKVKMKPGDNGAINYMKTDVGVVDLTLDFAKNNGKGVTSQYYARGDKLPNGEKATVGDFYYSVKGGDGEMFYQSTNQMVTDHGNTKKLINYSDSDIDKNLFVKTLDKVTKKGGILDKDLKSAKPKTAFKMTAKELNDERGLKEGDPGYIKPTFTDGKADEYQYIDNRKYNKELNQLIDGYNYTTELSLMDGNNWWYQLSTRHNDEAEASFKQLGMLGLPLLPLENLNWLREGQSGYEHQRALAIELIKKELRNISGKDDFELTGKRYLGGSKTKTEPTFGDKYP